MKLRTIALIALPGALMACGSNTPTAEDAVATSDNGAMSVQEVKAELADAIRPMPGKYESKIEITSIDIPGLPPAQAQQMKSMMGGMMGQVQSYCLTPEEAEKGFEQALKESQKGECAFESFNVSGGKMDGRMRCKMEGGEGVMDMTGTGTPTSSDTRMNMVMTNKSLPGGRMTMAMHVTSKRIGDCKA